jgi:hypothetical protein
MYTNTVLAPRLQHTNIKTYGNEGLFSSITANSLNLGINTDTNFVLAVSGNSLFYNDVTISGTLSAQNVFFTSITSVQISISSQELNFLGSVSITGDNINPISQHLFQVYRPSNNIVPVFYVSSAGLIGIQTKFPTSTLSISGDLDLSGNYKYFGTNGISSPNFSNYLSQVVVSGGIVTSITNIAISSITGGIDFSPYTTTAQFVSATSYLNSNLTSLSAYVGNLNRFVLSADYISVTSNFNSSIGTLSSNQISNSGSITSLSAQFIASTASLTGATIFNKTLATGKVFLTNTSNNVQLGADSGLTGIKLDVQGVANLGNTVTIGAVGEKGRITWGSSPQATSFYSLSTNDVAIGTKQSGELIRGTTAGNIGIGTTTPNAKFTVLGNISSTGTTTHIGNTSISGTLSNTGLLMSATSTNSGLFVLTTGRVGIGTNTPQQLLNISSSQPIVRITNTTNLGTTLWAGTEIGKLEFYSSDLSQPSVVANISAIGSNDSAGGVCAGDLGFFTKNASGALAEKLRITDLGHISFSGGSINSSIANNSVTSNLLQSTQTVTYQKGANYVIAFNDAGTMKYRYLVLTGTDAVWNYSTVAP